MEKREREKGTQTSVRNLEETLRVEYLLSALITEKKCFCSLGIQSNLV